MRKADRRMYLRLRIDYAGIAVRHGAYYRFAPIQLHNTWTGIL
jgi:hypothetical protein